jgi:predicted AlkP superfamily phosphohydrolase/phosphomutase
VVLPGRVVVLGLDGATWDLLDVLVHAGKMPNLGALVKRGARGRMRSVSPPVTAPAWISMATGVNPGRHGCFDFNRPQGSLGTLRPLQTWDIAEKTFYEILEERGRRSILVNLPGTFPPLTRQITLTSLLTQGDDAVFPRDLKGRHPALAGYRIFPDTTLRLRGDAGAYLRDIRAVEAGRAAAVKALWDEPWDVFFAVVSGTDWVSHEAFGALLRGEWDLAREGAGVFEDADALLGWIAQRLGPEDHLLLVSDHGFREAKGVLFINEWLIRKGFARPDFARPAFPASHRMEEQAQREALRGASRIPRSILGTAFHYLPARLAAKALRRLGVRWPFSLAVDAARSRAWVLTAESSGVTVNEAGRWQDGTVKGGDVPALVSGLLERLGGLKDPDGAPVFESARDRAEVYRGICTGNAPHVVLEPGPWGIAAAVRSLPGAPFVRRSVGIHSPEGIFAGFGPAFAEGAEVGGMTVLDVAPLLFLLAGEAIPSGLDGGLHGSLFKRGFLDRSPAEYRDVSPPVREEGTLEGEEVQARLRGLGYMG